METNGIIKKIIWTVVVISIVFTILALRKPNAKARNGELEGTISISGAFALYPIAVRWGEEFRKIHPGVKFDISAGGAGKAISDVLGGLVDLGAVSRKIYPEEVQKGAHAFAVARDAVVATMNSANPNLNGLLEKGLTQSMFARIYGSDSYTNWTQVGFAISAPLHVYTRSDASGAGETWAGYLGRKQEDLGGIGLFGDPGLLQAVLKDPDGIGYNTISYAFDAKTRKPLPGIRIVPIDLNGNGKIDADENFYNTLDDLNRAVAWGKYPSPPSRNLYFVSKNEPQRKELIVFLEWVLSDGQKFLDEAGYVGATKGTSEKEQKD